MPDPQGRQRNLRQSGHKARPQQFLIKDAHATQILGVAILEKAAEGEAFEENACLRGGKVLTVIHLGTAASGSDQPSERSAAIAKGVRRADPRRAAPQLAL